MLKIGSPYSERYMLLLFKNSDNRLKHIIKPQNLRPIHTIKTNPLLPPANNNRLTNTLSQNMSSPIHR